MTLMIFLILHFSWQPILSSAFKNQAGFHSPLSIFFRPAGDVTLNLGLVDTVHGKPNHRSTNTQAPEGVSQPWVKTEASVETLNIVKRTRP